jgi:hypothetical protein
MVRLTACMKGDSHTPIFPCDVAKQVATRIFVPERIQDKWDCRYEIDWPGGPIRSHAGSYGQ